MSPNLLSSICPFYIFSLCPLITVSCSWLSFCASCLLSSSDSFRVLQWNAGGLRSRSTELLYFLSSHPVDFICIQVSNLDSSSSFRIPGFSALHSDRTHSRSGILSPDTTHASGGVVIFVRQGISFSELSTSSVSSLHPYSDYVGVNISLNNSSSVSFLIVYAPLFAPTNSRTNSFSPSILPSSRNLFILGDFNLTGSSLLTSSPSMTLTYSPFSIAPLLTSPLLFPAPGRCFRTWVLTIYQFFYPSLSPVYRPHERPLFLQFS